MVGTFDGDLHVLQESVHLYVDAVDRSNNNCAVLQLDCYSFVFQFHQKSYQLHLNFIRATKSYHIIN